MSAKIDVQKDKIVIKNLEIDDRDIVSYLSDLESEEDVTEEIKRALKVGTIALKGSKTVELADFLEKRVDNIKQELKDKLLDASKEGTPFNKVKSDIEEELSNLKTEILKEVSAEKAAEEERKKGTQKGFDFQDDKVGPNLGELARVFGDNVENTSEESGPLGDVGDFVVRINSEDCGGIETKIVFEAKDRKDYSRKKILKELENAKKNRGAEVGVMVFSQEAASSLRSEIKHYQYYSNDKCFVCCIDDTTIPLEVAYKRARYLATKKTLEEEAEVDIKQVENLASAIDRKLEEFSNIKRSITEDKNTLIESLEDSYDGIYEKLDNLEKDLQKSVDKFGSAIQVSSN
ncbi:MAG: hypothetical protein ABEK36_01470 [Candidatus Aenigmatarchaeota archaeon]